MPAQTVIQLRRDTEANWVSTNPTLAAGEIGYDSTNNQLKIGNGTDNWNALSYASGGASVGISETAPEDPEVGDVWYSSAEGRAYIYYDDFWVELNPGITGPGVASGGTAGQILTKVDGTNYNTAWEDLPESAAVISSATAPANTSAIWFNTETGISYVYYDDFWTSIAGSSGAPIISDTAPTDPVLGTQWFNSSTGKSYLYYSNAWVEVDSNGTSTLSTGNAIINGAFEINQRNFTSGSAGGYVFDRWTHNLSGASGTASVESFTLGTAPVAGYEGTNFARINTTVGNDKSGLRQTVESVRSFAGQTVTISFFAKGTNPATAGSLNVLFTQVFGTGGSPSSPIDTESSAFVLTPNWTRYSLTVNIPTIAGKTLGTNKDDYLALIIGQGINASTDAWTLDIWGVQLEAGAVATPFRRNAPSIQAELAACQRYYWRIGVGEVYSTYGIGVIHTATSWQGIVNHPVPMRTKATSYDATNLAIYDPVSGLVSAVTTLTFTPTQSTLNSSYFVAATSGFTGGRTGFVINANNSAGFLGVGAEL